MFPSPGALTSLKELERKAAAAQKEEDGDGKPKVVLPACLHLGPDLHRKWGSQEERGPWSWANPIWTLG